MRHRSLDRPQYLFPRNQEKRRNNDPGDKLQDRPNHAQPAVKQIAQTQFYLLFIMSDGILWAFLQLLPERADILTYDMQIGDPGRQYRKTIRLYLVYPGNRFPYMVPHRRNNK